MRTVCICVLLMSWLTSEAVGQGGVLWYEEISSYAYDGGIGWLSAQSSAVHTDDSYTIAYGADDYYALSYLLNNRYTNYHGKFRPGRAFHLDHFSESGTLLWSLRFPTTVSNYHPSCHIQLDRNGNTLMAVSFEGEIWYGYDSLSAFKSLSAHYGIAAFIVSPQGYILSSRLVAESSGRMEVQAMARDSSDNVYVSGIVWSSSSSWEGENVSTRESRTYFLAAFQPSFERTWLHTFRTGWDAIGTVAGIVYNVKSDQLNAVVSLGSYDIQSSCKNRSWPLNLQVWSSSGEQVLSETMAWCDDLMVAGDVAVDVEGNVMIVGRFRGALQAGAYNYTSPYDSSRGCSVSNTFVMRVEESGHIVSAQHFSHPALHSLHCVRPLSDGRYLLGGLVQYNEPSSSWIGSPYPSGLQRTFIAEYDYIGNELSRREFNKRSDNSSSPYDYSRLDFLSNGDFIVADCHGGKYDTIARSTISDDRDTRLSILRMRHPKSERDSANHSKLWTLGLQAFGGASLYLYSVDAEYRIYDLEIYDILGKLLVSRHVEDGIPCHQEALQTFASGSYILRIRGNGHEQVERFVVVN